MAEGVVDVLEIVQVNEQQCTLPAATRGGSQCMLEPIHKKPPVGQASERVVERQILDFCFCRLAFRKVDVYPDIIRDDLIISFNGGNGEPCGIYFAVFASIPDFSLPCSGALDGLPYRAIEVRVVAARLEQARCLAHGFLERIAGG